MNNLLLLHGALASKSQFDGLLPMLKEDLQTEAINFSGHGGTMISPMGYSFNVFANDILVYADKHKIDRINLFGYSMGGYAALYFAKLYPERVNRIFTLNVKFNWDADSTQKEIAMLNAENMLLKVPSFANNLMLLHGLDLWKNVLSTTAEMMNSLAKHVILTDDDLRAIECQVMLSIGDRDKTSSVEETVAIYRKMKNAQLCVWPGTPHQLEKVNAEKLAAEMKQFFGT